MDPYGEIIVMNEYDHILYNAKDIRVGMKTLNDVGDFDPYTKIFFTHRSKEAILMSRLTLINMENDEMTTVMLETNSKITFGHYNYRINDIPHDQYLELGRMGKKYRVVKREFLISKPTYIFTESGYIFMNDILLYVQPSFASLHLRYINRLLPLVARAECYLFGKYMH